MIKIKHFRVGSIRYFLAVFVLGLSVLTSTVFLHPKQAHASGSTLPTYRYTKTLDVSASGAFAVTSDVATDSSGNVYVVGYFNGTVGFDGIGGSDRQTALGGNSDAFLTKRNTNGTYSWTKIFDTTNGTARGLSLATDSSGNVYLTGTFQGTVIFDGTGGSDSETDPGGNQDTFLTKYNANGTYGFTKIFDTSASGAYTYGIGIAVDVSGNVYMTGNFGGTVIFDGVGGSDTRTTVHGSVYLTKYNANGTYGFTKIFDTSASINGASPYAVVTDGQGDIFMTGNFDGTVVFDGVGGSDSQTAAGNHTDTFLTKYNPNGSYSFTKIFDSSASNSFSYGAGVATDSLGNIYVTGYFDGTVGFDGVGGSDSQTSANGDTFLTKYNPNGTYGWTKIFDASASVATAQGSGIAIDAQDNIYLTGYFYGTVGFDGVGGTDSQTTPNYNTYLTRYNANGTYGWTKIFDTTNGSTGDSGIATDNLGNVFFGSVFSGTIGFDGVGGHDSQTAAGSNFSGFLTSYQAFTPSTPNVSTVSDPINGQSVTLTTPSACTNQSATISDASSNAVKDSYTYPAGLLSFTTDCHTPGYTAAITIDFYGLTNKNLVLRKYNPNTKTYSTVPNATLTNTTINGQPVVEATYSITDGGPLDQDGAANGIIVDPVGLAVAPAAPNTGFGAYLSSPLRILLTFSSLAVLLASVGIFMVVGRRYSKL